MFKMLKQRKFNGIKEVYEITRENNFALIYLLV